MSPKKELQLARTTYQQAQEKVMREQAAWEALQGSYKTLIVSLENCGMSRKKAQAEFDGYMRAHADSFKAALKYLSQVSVDLAVLLKRYPDSLLD
jgi:hypothetical protein